MHLQPPNNPAEGAAEAAVLPVPPYRSLRAQMALAFGLLVAAVAGTLSIIIGDWVRDRMQLQASEALHLVASNASRLLADGLDSQLRVVKVLSQSEDLWKDGVGSSSVQALLARMQLTQPHHLWIGTTDAQGVVRTATAGLLVGQDVQSRPWFQNGIQHPYVGDVHPAKLLAELVQRNRQGEPQRFLDFAAPIVQQGQTLGVIAVHGSWDWATDVIEGLLPSETLSSQPQVFLFSREGQMIYAPGGRVQAFEALGQQFPELRLPQNGAGVAQLLQWQDQSTPFLTTMVNLSARDPVADLGWRIVVRQPVHAAYAESRRAMWVVLLVGGVAALLAAGAAILLSTRIGNDLRALAQAASAIHAGAYHTPLPVGHSTSDVHALSQALAGMMQRLVQAHNSLEQQVQERTQQLREANAELERQANTDPLTGLLNRRGFHHQMSFALALARRSGRPLALLTLDIDHFKRVNDTWGHDVGDLVLQSMAQVLRVRLRESDIVARMGGEEFVVVLPDTPREAALQAAESLRKMVADHPIPTVGHITVSIGLSMLPLGTPHTASVLEARLLQRSDQALYRAKQEGRNRVVVSEEDTL